MVLCVGIAATGCVRPARLRLVRRARLALPDGRPSDTRSAFVTQLCREEEEPPDDGGGGGEVDMGTAPPLPHAAGGEGVLELVQFCKVGGCQRPRRVNPLPVHCSHWCHA
jgi:hypothetical protein